MKAYKVLKEFPSSDGGCIHKEGSRYKPTKSASRTANLERLGYIEELPKQPKTVWDLKVSDTCYHIMTDGLVHKEGWTNQEQEQAIRDLGNVFLTREEAEKELARRKAKQILLRDTKGFKPKFGANCSIEDFGYEVQYEIDVDGLYAISYKHNDGTIRFATEEDAKASIKAHEKEWKTYLGVEG